MCESKTPNKLNFFIIGAPRSGTTALSSWLSEHPEVFMPQLKEPNYYNTDLNCSRIRSSATYNSLFSSVLSQHKAIGEATSTYLFSKKAVLNIRKNLNNPKFIVLLRDPIDMAVSFHRHQLFNGNEDEKDFEGAWRLQKSREQGFQIPRGCIEPQLLLYGTLCSIGEQIKRLINQVDEENLLILFYDDLKSSPENLYNTVLNFLGVTLDGRTHFEPENQSKGRRSELVALILRKISLTKKKMGVAHWQTGILTPIIKRNSEIDQKTPNLSPPFMDELKAYFYEDQRLLKEITGRSSANWL